MLMLALPDERSMPHRGTMNAIVTNQLKTGALIFLVSLKSLRLIFRVLNATTARVPTSIAVYMSEMETQMWEL